MRMHGFGIGGFVLLMDGFSVGGFILRADGFGIGGFNLRTDGFGVGGFLVRMELVQPSGVRSLGTLGSSAPHASVYPAVQIQDAKYRYFSLQGWGGRAGMRNAVHHENGAESRINCIAQLMSSHEVLRKNRVVSLHPM